MKRLVLLTALATGLAASASAAITAGFEAGYLTDNKDAYWSGRVGWEFNATSNFSHQVELELGYTQHTETLIGTLRERTKLTPITINYRAETTVADKLGYYFGAGLGQTHVGFSMPGSGAPSISDSGNAFTLQAFAGINYKVTAAATVHVGVKYLRIDDVKMFGNNVEVGDDIALTAGVSIKF